jgi:hypothetical protein
MSDSLDLRLAPAALAAWLAAAAAIGWPMSAGLAASAALLVLGAVAAKAGRRVPLAIVGLLLAERPQRRWRPCAQDRSRRGRYPISQPTARRSPLSRGSPPTRRSEQDHSPRSSSFA